ncbi:MAG: hypothetical protein K2M19_08760 [Muribaculaceae bacterium]|nr:hypothetical protein [Muribaculaceae bacterium]
MSDDREAASIVREKTLPRYSIRRSRVLGIAKRYAITSKLSGESSNSI